MSKRAGLLAVVLGGFLLVVACSSAETQPKAVAPSASEATTPQPAKADATDPSSLSSVEEPATSPYVFDCVKKAAVLRPSELLVACGDGGVDARTISWQTWNPDTATASATIYANDCDPTCAAGAVHDFPAELTLGEPHDIGGTVYYSRLTVRYLGASPSGQPTENWPLGP